LTELVNPKIVYLLGAGATHAEILNLEENPSETFRRNNGLLISDVSKRVMEQVQKDNRFKKNIEMVTSLEGSLNIELLMSLISSNRIPNSDYKTNRLKELVREDILKRLSKTRKKKFYLHRALLEMHKMIGEKETLLGIISLNYDDVLDEAYSEIFERKPNYCLTSLPGIGEPLLKPHGSFNWKNIKVYEKLCNIPIIPLGINKNYLSHPYNFIWGKSLEILSQCNILRVIGCAMNQNDIGLIDLLFKAHLLKGTSFFIEIIDFQVTGDSIKSNYGFFPGIIKPLSIEGSLIADETIEEPTKGGNPFKIWLKAKTEKLIKENIEQTKYIKKCI
jgi:hypothetical protein